MSGIVQRAPWASQPPEPERPRKRKTAKADPRRMVRVNRETHLSALADAIRWQEYVQARRDPASADYQRSAALVTRYRQAYSTARGGQPAGRPRKLTEDQAREALAAIRSGEPKTRVAGRYGVTPATLRLAVERLSQSG